MKKQKWIVRASKGYVLLSALSFSYVGVLAFFSPQAVMDFVGVKLTNNDAFSSIRGVYGGVGLTIVSLLLYTLWKNLQESLVLLAGLWGLYAVSRLVTVFAEGPLGAFGQQWLLTESVFFLLAVALLFANRYAVNKPDATATAG